MTEDLRAELTALTNRVEALERSANQPPATSGSTPSRSSSTPDEPPPDEPPPGTIDAALIERLQSRTGAPFQGATSQGSILYAGAAQLPDGAYAWQMERPVPGLLTTDDHVIAGTLSAMASPARLRLLKAVLAGATESHQLHQALGDVSTGQLYHHLKELTAAGLVVQQGRGRYQVPPHCVVPLLAVIAAAYDLTTPDQTHDPA